MITIMMLSERTLGGESGKSSLQSIHRKRQDRRCVQPHRRTRKNLDIHGMTLWKSRYEAIEVSIIGVGPKERPTIGEAS